MEGITVLSENVTQIINYNGIAFLSFFIPSLLLIVCMIVFGTDYPILGSILGVTGFVLLICGVVLFMKGKDNTEQYSQKCTISKDVKLLDFYEKYDIISKEGDIWEIKLKETK